MREKGHRLLLSGYGKTVKCMLAFLLAFAMVLASVPWAGGADKLVVKADAGDTFTLYYYDEADRTIYLNIWNHTGLTIADSATTKDWGWDHPVAVLQKVPDTEHLYATELKIVDASVNDGMTFYAEDASTTLIEYDNQWNNTSDYGVFISGESNTYVVKGETLYKSLEDAGFSGSSSNYSKEMLEQLLATLPSDLSGYTEASVTAVTAAKTSAENCIADADADAAAIESAYKSLAEAIDGLSLAANIYVEPVSGITKDTIRGMDVSSYLSIMDSFAELNKNAGTEKYGFRDYNGNLLTKQGFFDFLAAQGVNYIRLRVWNNPYDGNGNGYGGGNNDVEKAVEMGKYATKAGMKVLIDFHYSDFWADPGKQQAPKEWSGYTISQKAEAVKQFTTDSLNTLLDAGVDVGMVQVGNETNGAMAGVKGGSSWEDNLDVLFDAGCDAVHAVADAHNTQILAAVHFTNPEKSGNQAGYAKQLAKYDNGNGVSYDVFATSYYPYWHGSLSNLTAVLKDIAETYGKDVMVAETSYAYTLEDTDGHPNTVRTGNNDTGADVNWLFTVQGQANEFRDVLNSVVKIQTEDGNKGLGVFYWEGAWITLQDVNVSGKADNSIVESNKQLWEKYGSGWASSYAAEYDAEDAGKWYGGSAVDNQAFFAADGTALASLGAFNYDYLSQGATPVKQRDGYTADAVTIQVGDTLTAEKLGTVTLIYNEGTKEAVEVNWNAQEIANLNQKAQKNSGTGTYTVSGTLASDADYAVTVKVIVVPKNLIQNESFETTEDTGWAEWTITQSPEDTLNASSNDSRTGTGKVPFWSNDAFEFTVSQQVPVTDAGTYRGYVYAQGSDGTASIQLKVTVGDTTYEGNVVSLTGWANWNEISIADIEITQEMITKGETVTYQILGKGEPAAWGTVDDAYFYLDKATETTVTPQPAASGTIITATSASAENTSGTDSGTDTGSTPASSVTYTAAATEDGTLKITASDGSSVSDELVTTADGKTYYCATDGTVATDKVVQSEGEKYFAKEDGEIAKSEFCQTAKGNLVYATEDGTLAAGEIITVEGKKYYAKASGAIATDGLYKTASGEKVYAKASGELAVYQVVTVNDKKYFAGKKGTILKGGFYKTASGKKVYAGAKSGALVTGRTFKVNGDRYYANQNGTIITNKWVTIGKRQYYCSASGKITKVRTARK